MDVPGTYTKTQRHKDIYKYKGKVILQIDIAISFENCFSLAVPSLVLEETWKTEFGSVAFSESWAGCFKHYWKKATFLKPTLNW